MSDLISRQAAIDALAKEMPSLTTPDGCGEFDHDIQITDEAFVDCMQIINDLPSAQPEPCEDTVSRQRLLSDLKELVVAWEKYPVMAEQIKGVEAAIGYVETIPSAQPEQLVEYVKEKKK